jgi:peptide/nickel transport system substrate-binding protein
VFLRGLFFALLLIAVRLPAVDFPEASAQGGDLAGTKWGVEATYEWNQREFTTFARFVGEVELFQTGLDDYFLLNGTGSGDWRFSSNEDDSPCEPYSGNGQIDVVTFSGSVSVATLDDGKTETHVSIGGVPGRDPSGADIEKYIIEQEINCHNPYTGESWTEKKATPPPGIAGASGTMAEMMRGVEMNTDLSSAEPGAFVKVTAKISPPGVTYRVYGTVKDSEGNALSGSKLVVGDFETISTNGEIKKLSQSKPEFEDDTTASKDNAEYEFKLERPADKLAVKLLVVSLLWYDDNGEFAITNGEIVSGRYIPVYIPICVDHSGINCVKWEKTGDGFEAKVDFVYGKALQPVPFIELEDWQMGSSGSMGQLMAESAKVYYNSYRAMKYFEGLKGVAVSLNPVMIQVRYQEAGCTSAEYDAAAMVDRDFKSFGDLGKFLSKVEATGSRIKICDTRSLATWRDIPVNREWHELSHYLNFNMYINFDRKPYTNHAGYENPSTNDSLAEGFAEFVAMLIAEHYGSRAPYQYPIYSSPGVNLETDYKVWGGAVFLEEVPETGGREVVTILLPFRDEEYAIAGILWDLHDSGVESNPRFVSGQDANGADIWAATSKIYPNPSDRVSLPGDAILGVISAKKPLTLLDVYSAFTGTVAKEDLDMIFVNHAAFNDVADRNLIQDLSGEVPGPTGHTPGRLSRADSPPAINGSYLVAESDATFSVRFVHEEPFGNYDFSYLINMTADEPAYFQMSPQYYPSNAIFDQVSSDGKTTIVSNATTIDSNQYWNHFRSDQEVDAVFRTLPVSGQTTSDSGSTGGEPRPADSTSQPSGCLIATAAFGSELTPQVQFLRGFRDNHIQLTASGSSFMGVFNAWYYSFSPQVADYERQQPWFQQSVRIAIYPLLGILQAAEKAFTLVPGEYGSIAAGLVASSLIGAVYFSPIALSIVQVRNNRLDYRLVIVIIAALVISVVVAMVANSVPALMGTTTMLVLVTLSIAAIYAAKAICKIFKALLGSSR